MAQTGYTPILIYSSSTVSQAPSAGNLTNSTLGSELAINITDGKLFYKDNANAVQVIGWKITPTTAGGTGLTSYTAGDLLYYASGTTLSKLAIGTSGQWLGSSGTAPQWNSPAALTKTDDTNVTLTLGGSASTALLNAASLTLGWTGQLAASRGGTGIGTYTAGDLLYASGTTTLSKLAIGTANYVLTSSGSAPQWTAGSSVSVGTASNLLSNATTGVMQIVGPAASTTRVMTIPNANFTAARTDAAQTFTGAQSFGNNINLTDSTAATINFATLSSATTNYIQTYSDGYSMMLYVDRGVSKPSYLMSFGGTHQWGFAGTSSMELDVTNKDLTLKTGNLVQGTAAKGINFTANSAAAGMTSQLLNWYEQGTFTPTLAGSTGNPTSTYTTQAGYYTRVGNVVTIYIQLFTSSYTGGSGTLQVKSLPYAATNGARFNINTVRITFGASAVQVCGAVDGGSTTIYFDESNSNATDTTLALSAWNSGASAGMTIFGSYIV